MKETLIYLNYTHSSHTTTMSYCLHVPLPFNFASNTGLDIPLLALQYHAVRLGREKQPEKELPEIRHCLLPSGFTLAEEESCSQQQSSEDGTNESF